MAHHPVRQVALALGLGVGLVLLGASAAQAATTASLNGAGRLTVTGTSGADTIVVRAVNATTIEVASLGVGRRFPASAVHSIQVNGGGGNDNLRIEDARLAFTQTRPTTLDGGNGNDTIRGGKGGETLRGGAGTDSLTWNVGKGNDQVDGGAGSDTVHAVGRPGADAFTMGKQGTRSRILVSGAGSVRSAAVEVLDVQGAGGSDTITAGNLAGLGLTSLTINGGGGDPDQMIAKGTAGPDTVAVTSPAPGSWTVTGLAGGAIATVQAEAMRVEPGDDNDLVSIPGLASNDVQLDGGAGTDQLAVTGTAGPDVWQFVPNGSGLALVDGGNVRVNAEAVETVTGNLFEGVDIVTVPNLVSTPTTTFTLDFTTLLGGPEASVDTINVVGTDGIDSISAAAVNSTVQLTGLGPAMTFSGTTTADLVDVHGGAQNDTLTGGVGLAAITQLRLEGEDGSDVLNGGNGADVLLGGNNNDTVDGNGGNDTAFQGEGNDTFHWDPGDGSDIVEGQGGIDELDFNGAPGAEIFAASSNGGRLLFTRNVGNIVMDVDDVETLDLHALGGIDTITVNALGPTDIGDVFVDLGVNSVGDASQDAVTVNGTVADDSVQVTPLSGGVGVRQPEVDVVITFSELANDTLTINTSGGDDGVTSSSSGLGVLRYTFNAGAGNDVVVGTAGDDTINGDDNDDTMFGRDGNDTFTGGAGTDIAFGGAGADVNGGGIETFNQ